MKNTNRIGLVALFVVLALVSTLSAAAPPVRTDTDEAVKRRIEEVKKEAARMLARIDEIIDQAAADRKESARVRERMERQRYAIIAAGALAVVVILTIGMYGPADFWRMLTGFVRKKKNTER